jgi:hypothetical protein
MKGMQDGWKRYEGDASKQERRQRNEGMKGMKGTGTSHCLTT